MLFKAAALETVVLKWKLASASYRLLAHSFYLKEKYLKMRYCCPIGRPFKQASDMLVCKMQTAPMKFPSVAKTRTYYEHDDLDSALKLSIITNALTMRSKLGSS